jgi:hypothetical protein
MLKASCETGLREAGHTMSKMKTAVLALVLAAAGSRGPAAQQPAAGSGLPALDYYQLKQLYARFSHGLDSAARNGDLFAQTFTADGVLTDDTGKTYTGHDQLAALARSTPNAGPTNVVHYVVNMQFEPIPGGALGRSDVMIGNHQAGQARGVFVNAGEYWDVLVKTSDGWRIKRRDFYRIDAVPASMPRPTLPPAETAPKAVAGANGPTALRLTAGDYAEIEQLYAKYSHGFDSSADRGRMWANLFTADGFHRNYPNQYILGREALAEFAYDERGVQAGTKTPLSALHFITQTMLEPSPEGIISKSYLMYVRHGAEGQATTVYPGGIYIDVLVKTPQGWRFKEKNVILNNGPIAEPAKRLIGK